MLKIQYSAEMFKRDFKNLPVSPQITLMTPPHHHHFRKILSVLHQSVELIQMEYDVHLSARGVCTNLL
jgi:hypothetical protein